MKMTLRKITPVLIIGLVLSFSVRTVGTLFPNIFINAYTVKFTVVVNTLFILLHLLFYVFFLKEYAANRQQVLRTGSGLAIIGTFFVACIYLKNFCLAFGLEIIPLFLNNPYPDAILPLASSALHLAFFCIFKKVQSQEEFRVLNRPISLALIGVGIFSVLHLLVLINFLIFQRFNWLEHMPRAVSIGTVPLIVLAAIFLYYFYFRFYQFLSETG